MKAAPSLGDLAALAVARRRHRLVERLRSAAPAGFSDAVRAVAGLALFETGVHGRLAAAHRVIALVLGHGMAIYQPYDGLSIFYNRKIGFSLPFPCQASDYLRAPIPNP
jgi:hypothetical protein